jgi:hypothetical protein
MRFHATIAPARLALAALGTGGLLLSEGCRSDELQGPAHGPEGLRMPAMATAPTNGLVGEWKLDETSGTIANDTKNNYDATVFGGAAFVAGKLGNALNLNNGTSGAGAKYAEMPSNATLDNVQEANYTISAWFYPYSIPPFTTPENKNWAIVNKQGQHMGLVYEHGGTFAARHWITGDTLKWVHSAAYPANAWYHVVSAVSKSAGTVKLYVNGALEGTASFTPGTAAREYGAYPFRIGKARLEWVADGKVDQVRIYNRELSGTEVGDLYNETVEEIGVPFGPFSAWQADGRTPQPNTSVFSMGMTSEQPDNIIQRLAYADTIGKKVMLNITGGGHNNYKTPPNDDGEFDYAKWKARVDLFADNQQIRTAVTEAFNNGTLLGFNMMDEPQAADWNNVNTPNTTPPHTIRITKQTLDSMASYMKLKFGSQIPMGVSVRSDWHLGDPRYQVLDFINTQFVAAFNNGSASAWRDEAFENVDDDKVKLLFSLNVLNGGAGFAETPQSCASKPETGGFTPLPGYPRCSMGAGQIETFGTQVMGTGYEGKKGVGLTLWEYNSTYFQRTDIQSAFADVAAVLDAAPQQSWLRYP